MAKPSQNGTSRGADGPVHVLHVTDSHLFAQRTGRLLGLVTYDSLTAVLAAAAAEPPDMVLATGDLAQDGTAQAYAHLAEAFSGFAAACPLPPPVYWLPGNHDEPAVMRATLTCAPLRPETEVVVGGWYIILLDSTVPGEVGGALSEDELARLDAGLRAHADCPALVCLHHNPVVTSARWMDDIGLANADAFCRSRPPSPSAWRAVGACSPGNRPGAPRRPADGLTFNLHSVQTGNSRIWS